MRRNVLVVDWGGGTLDLTLCRVEPGRIRQFRNGGRSRSAVTSSTGSSATRSSPDCRGQDGRIAGTDHPSREAHLRLLQEAEPNKIELSERASVTLYRPSYFPE